MKDTHRQIQRYRTYTDIFTDKSTDRHIDIYRDKWQGPALGSAPNMSS